MDDSLTISEMKSDVAECRHRLRTDLENVRDAMDVRDVVRDTVRKHPLLSVAAAAVSGAVVASSFLPHGRRSPLGALVGGCLAMAYRGFFLAATPLFAIRVVDYLVPPSRSRGERPSERRTPPAVGRREQREPHDFATQP